MPDSSKSSGIGLAGVVFIVFLILKLAKIGEVANWNWWWVTSPLWIPFLIVMAVLLIIFLVSILRIIFFD